MPKLHVANGGLEGTTFHLLEKRVTVGRTDDNLIHIDDSTVSKHHAVLLWESTGYKLQDLGSTNGTRVNGEPITEVPLSNGDTVAFGDIELRYEAPSGKPARTAQPALSPPPATAPPTATPDRNRPAAVTSPPAVISPPSGGRLKIGIRSPESSGPPPLPKPPPLPNK